MSPNTPPPRTEGSNPSLSATSQSPEIRDKRDKPAFEVGAPYIFPLDRPSGYWCVIVTHESGIAHYLNIHHGCRWPHALDLAKLGRDKATPLHVYGVTVENVTGALVFDQKQPSSAAYDDGEPQRWQPEYLPKEWLRLKATNPKRWRLDPKVLPKLLAWIERHPDQLASPLP